MEVHKKWLWNYEIFLDFVFFLYDYIVLCFPYIKNVDWTSDMS